MAASPCTLFLKAKKTKNMEETKYYIGDILYVVTLLNGNETHTHCTVSDSSPNMSSNLYHYNIL